MQRAALTKQLYGAPTQFAAANKKFAVGKNPLELESELDVIQPQNAQQQKRMVEVMEALAKALAILPAWLAFNEGGRDIPKRRRAPKSATSARV